MEAAAKHLQSAAAFQLWIYFAKNQDKYTFALSSKEVENSFGMKIKQYNNAVKTLIDKGYLLKAEGNTYNFYEKSVNTFEDNSVNTFEDNSVNTMQDKK